MCILAVIVCTMRQLRIYSFWRAISIILSVLPHSTSCNRFNSLPAWLQLCCLPSWSHSPSLGYYCFRSLLVLAIPCEIEIVLTWDNYGSVNVLIPQRCIAFVFNCMKATIGKPLSICMIDPVSQSRQENSSMSASQELIDNIIKIQYFSRMSDKNLKACVLIMYQVKNKMTAGT